ncbi:hypothetical protein BGX34_003463 [Mortierella sp. NVP85]|nr:hypothetical protein BGX34_003463 [Mortierella sp. NVP85]
MRFSVVALVAAVAAVANAQSDAYPFKPNGPCIKNCLDTVGKKMFADFTDDPANPNFMASLALAHERGTPKYTSYMTDTGMCFVNSKCPQEEQDLYSQQYEAKNEWYQKNKNAGGKKSGASTSGIASGLVGTVALLGAVALF